MRNKLIKLLRELEQESDFKNEYSEWFEDYNCDYSVEESIDFPNYKLIISRYNKKYPTKNKDGLVIEGSNNGIKAELKRMEADNLVMIGVQEGIKNATTVSNCNGPDFDDNAKFTTESVVLTTKGKSGFGYLLYQLEEQRFSVWALFLSFISILISLLAINIDKLL